MNLDFLTHSHHVKAAKRRSKREQVAEVVFDESARREFLTGFHKRKVAKAEAAKKKAAEREKQQRLEDRREQRRLLRERAAENAAQVEAAYGAVSSDPEQEEWNGIQEQAEEFEDEQTLATVTVIEDFDPDLLIHGPDTRPQNDMPVPSVSSTSPDKPKRPKRKPKEIKYQTKAARKVERTKQRARRVEKAELAGGKSARKRRRKA